MYAEASRMNRRYRIPACMYRSATIKRTLLNAETRLNALHKLLGADVTLTERKHRHRLDEEEEEEEEEEEDDEEEEDEEEEEAVEEEEEEEEKEEKERKEEEDEADATQT
ncbi:hypothetical protein HZH68_006544 [Vespula germanica]|uniref:Uncharacterized protein n=1 Tax=Vespula germanica TaxID=30212 RepID=A0A834KBZ8_VESGE|nr:hypothetical protein HZH68_006544 [Vespula germanica]